MRRFLAGRPGCARMDRLAIGPQVGNRPHILIGSVWQLVASKTRVSTRLARACYFGRCMQTRQLGNSDLMITPLGIGAWAMGGAGWAFSWGPQDDNDSIAAIRAGVDAGLNWVDTAAVYGLGHSEEVVGLAMKGVSPKPYIFTKCERTWDSGGNIIKSLKKDSI